MRRIRMQIDISGTVGDGAWSGIRPFSEIETSEFGPQHGRSGPCRHLRSEPHWKGEWWGAVVTVDNHFLAEYALPHYLEQSRVIDAFIEAPEDGS